MAKQDLVAELESIVDRTSMVDVMIALELMCDEKAMFVDSAESIGLPNKPLARAWQRCGRHCRKVADLATEILP